MFKESATARFYLRSVVMAVIAGVAVAATIWVDNPYLKIASGVLGAFVAYSGLGYASPQVEPFVGNKLEGVEVPSPPAEPED